MRTVGLLVAAIGAALAVAGWRDMYDASIVVLAIAAAAGLATVDLVYVARRVIAPIYLADAVVEIALIAGWIVLYIHR